MKPGTQKAKGNSFENSIAKILSKWLTHGHRLDVLERSPGSGAKATVQLKAKKAFHTIVGDLISVHEESLPLINNFVVELKHQNETNLAISNLIFQTASTGIVTYWNKLLGECKTTQKLPMLIFRQNSRPILIALCTHGVKKFECSTLVQAIIRQPTKSMYIINFDQFLENVKPEKLK